MPAAVAVPLIVGAASTGATIYAANKSSNAAKEAAQTQTDAGEKALALQKEMWQQGRADLQPWMTQGGKAVNTLGYLMGLGGGTAAAPIAQTVTTGQNPRQTIGDYFGANPRAKGVADQYEAQLGQWREDRNADRRGRRLERLGGTADPTSMVAQTQSSYVTMRSPDGEEQPVPSQYVDHYRSLGATVIA